LTCSSLYTHLFTEIHPDTHALRLLGLFLDVDKKQNWSGKGSPLFVLIYDMKKVVLVFPGTSSMVDFLLLYRVSGIEANSTYLASSGWMGEKLLKAAVGEYGAEMVKPYSVERE